MILCITPNPAIDRTILLPHLIPGNAHRAQEVFVAAGGKGLNVARTIRTLGRQPLCMGFAGGHAGRWLADLAQEEGLHSAWTWTRAETRTCTILIAESGDATVINEPGMPVSTADWQRLVNDVSKQLPAAQSVCISGSLPPNSAVEDFQRLLHLLVDAGKNVWVDTSGTALHTAIAHPGLCIKVNASEIAEILAGRVDDVPSAREALRMLLDRRLSACVITLGPAGALLASPQGMWHARGPEMEIVSTVGSGDAFLGGLVSARDAGKDWPVALSEAVAAGTANALSPGGGHFGLEEFQQIRRQIQIESW